MHRNLLLFVKAPVPGFVKTRLTPPLTPEEAAQLSHAMAQDTLEVACQVKDTTVWIACQFHPELPSGHGLKVCQGVQGFEQEGDTLGERLQHATARVFEQKGGPVVVIGSDLPGLTSALLETAFGLLRSCPVVVGS